MLKGKHNLLLKSLKSVSHFALVATGIFFIPIFLVSCASSAVSRDVTAGIDMGMRNSNDLANDAYEGDISDRYQNSSQAAKGALIGGIAGGVTGAFSSGIGVFEGTAIGAVLGASYGAYIDSNTTLEDKLENRGVNVIVLGDQILIVVPSSRIFYENSSELKPTAYSTLSLITCFINRYTKTLLKITAFTADTGTCSNVTKALSKRQAENVMHYLLACGVNARLVYALGADGNHLVVSNCHGWDSDNYRIEITFEKLYV